MGLPVLGHYVGFGGCVSIGGRWSASRVLTLSQPWSVASIWALWLWQPLALQLEQLVPALMMATGWLLSCQWCTVLSGPWMVE